MFCKLCNAIMVIIFLNVFVQNLCFSNNEKQNEQSIFEEAEALVFHGTELYSRGDHQECYRKFELAYQKLHEFGLKNEKLKKYYQEIIQKLLWMGKLDQSKQDREKYWSDLFRVDPQLEYSEDNLSPDENIKEEFYRAKIAFLSKQKEAPKKDIPNVSDLSVKDDIITQGAFENFPAPQTQTQKSSVSNNSWYSQSWFYWTLGSIITSGIVGGSLYYFIHNDTQKNDAQKNLEMETPSQ